MTKQKTDKDIWLPLVIFVCIAISLSLILKLNLLISTLLFWGVPAFYFSISRKLPIMRILLFTLFATATFGLIVDYVGFINHVWYTPNTLFSVRLFDLIPLENFLWAFLYVYTVIAVYESTIRKQPIKPIKNMFFVIVVALTLFSIVLHKAVASTSDAFSSLSYIYLTAGILLFLIPLIVFLAKFRIHRSDLLKVTYYILPIALFNEVTALSLNHWYFPGNSAYITRLEMMGVSIPFEEMFFFIVIGAPAILMYYLFFFKGVDPKTALGRNQ